eukprot:9785294-Heterocapsa_arctica.AAC.1
MRPWPLPPDARNLKEQPLDVKHRYACNKTNNITPTINPKQYLIGSCRFRHYGVHWETILGDHIWDHITLGDHTGKPHWDPTLGNHTGRPASEDDIE